MRVSAKSKSGAVAGAIAGMIRSGEDVEVYTLGAAAGHQATKALCILTGFLKEDGIIPKVVMSFEVKKVDGVERTIVKYAIHGEKINE